MQKFFLPSIVGLMLIVFFGCGAQSDFENPSLDGGIQKETKAETVPDEPGGRECHKARGTLGEYEVGKNDVIRILWVRENHIIVYFTGGGKQVDRDNTVNGKPGAVCLKFK